MTIVARLLAASIGLPSTVTAGRSKGRRTVQREMRAADQRSAGTWATARATRALILLPALALGGCCSAPNCTKPLDQLACIAEEYGFTTISVPILSHPDERFEFDLNRPAKDYFASAKTEVQGSAGFFEQVVQSLAAGVSVQLDPTQVAAYAERVQQFFRDRKRHQDQDQQRIEIAGEKRAVAESRYERAQEEHAEAMARAGRESDPQVAQNLRNDANAAFDTAEKAWLTALDDYRDAVAPATPVPAFPTASGPDNTPPPAEGVARQPTEARAVLADPQFRDFGGLLKDTPNTVPDRTALITAAGDKAVEAIFRVLGNPEKAQEFAGQTVLFGISTVSVNPGWRTRSEFAADVNVKVTTGLQPARPETRQAFLHDDRVPWSVRLAILDQGELRSERWSNPAAMHRPHTPDTLPRQYGGSDRLDFVRGLGNGKRIPGAIRVVAVSPMTEVQTLDLASSYRRREELALRLALSLRQAGLGGQAEFFEQFVKDRQLDVRTRDAVASVSSYSTGDLYGFQIGPRLTALGDVTANRPVPEYELTRQTFPVLLIIGIDTSTAFPQLVPVPDKSACDGAATRLELVEPYIHLTETKSWTPLSPCAARYRLSDSKLLQMSDALAGSSASDSLATGTGVKSAQLEELYESRVEPLKAKVFGTRSFIPVPVSAMFPQVTPSIVSVIPAAVTLEQGEGAKTQKFTILGSHLSHLDLTKLRIDTGQVGIVSPPVLVGDAIQVGIEIHAAEEPLLLSLPRLDGQGTLYAPVVPIRLATDFAHVARVHPSRLQWTTADGNPPSKLFEVLLEGERLDRIDLDSLVVFSGRAAAEVKSCEFDAGGIRVAIEAKESGTVVLRMHEKSRGDDKLRKLLSPPISVSKQEAAGPTSDSMIIFETDKAGNKVIRTVTIPADSSPALLEAARDVLRADIEKAKPARTPSGGRDKSH